MNADSGPLRRTIVQAAAENRLPMSALTVLDKDNDPFRVDTPARHRDGGWLATTARELGLGDRTIHLRGLHYMVIGRPKPDGSPYANTGKDWRWLQEVAGKAARWLGYIPFEQIVDQRNAAPEIRLFTRPVPWPYISAEVRVDIPDADDIEPYVGALDFDGVQPYKLVLFGEKSSLEPVLSPIAEQYQADLYLPTGEISDTLIYHLAKVGAEDGRPMTVFYFADCDPSGWQMAVSVARKLQAFTTSLFPDLEFQMRRVALTPDQVREYGLPSTPLKETEKRRDKWRVAMGVEQTEIDALAALQPDLLARIAHNAIAPFYDTTLDQRVRSAYQQWRAQAQQRLDDVLDSEHLARIRSDAAARLSELREQIDAINNALRIDPGDVDLPPIQVPAANLNGGGGVPLLDSRWPFVEQCRQLINSKAYRTEAHRDAA